MSDLEKLLARLDTKKFNKSNKVDYKQIKKEREKAMYKMKEGSNYVVFLIPNGQTDPFVSWSYHNNLQEVSYYSVPCDHANKHEHCTICSLIEDLKKDEKQKHLWMPIELKTENYVPVIDVSSPEATVEGPKWMKVSTSILNVLITWLKNVEPGEQPFYSEEEPMKVIINYNSSALPKDKYSIDKKNTKPFSEEKLKEWKDSIKPLETYILSKSESDIKKMIDDYLERIEQLMLDGKIDDRGKLIADKKSDDKEQKSDDSSKEKKTSRLGSLKQ